MNLKIQSIHFNADQKLIDYISEKIEKIDHFFDQTVHTDIYLKLEKLSSEIHEKVVEIKVSLPGKVLFSTESSKAFEGSFDLALDHMVKQVKRHKEKIRG